VHQVTGHPGQHGMKWHQQHSINAAYTTEDSDIPRPVCTACVYGTMHQTPTDHRKEHRPNSITPGQQFSLDAFANTHKSSRGNKFCDLLTDLATGQIYPVFTKDRSAPELVYKAKILFSMHPAWRIPSPTVVRFVRIDPESNYNSQDFLSCLSSFGYEVERSPPRDKHANGVAERTVGLVTAKANTAMLAPVPRVPQRYWDLAMAYACHTMSFNCNSRINDSPYHYLHECRFLHSFLQPP
jgi:hypothetical protein